MYCQAQASSNKPNKEFFNRLVLLLPVEAVKEFKPHITGRPRKKEPQWRIYRGGITVIGTDIQVQILPGQLERLVEKLKAIYKGQRHTFPGTIERYIFKHDSVPATISIWLIWKATEMPDEEIRERDFAAFKAEFSDVLNWETAQITTKEGIIYT